MLTETATATEQEAGAGLTLQIGETSNAADKLTVSVNRLHTDTLFKESLHMLMVMVHRMFVLQ